MSVVDELRVGIVCLGVVHNTAIWIFHAVYTYEAPNINRIHSVSVSALTLVVAASINFAVVPYFTTYNGQILDIPLSQAFCRWIVFSSKLCFIYPKTVGLYYVYVERLIYIFKSNHYAFKKWQIWSMRGSLVLITMIWTVTALFVSEADYSSESNICSAHINRTVMVSWVAADFVICNFITVLYCRKLLIFAKRIDTRFVRNALPPNVAHRQSDKMYFKVMVKSTVLTFVASLTSQSFIVLARFMGLPSLWLSLDLMISSWCLICMYLYLNHLLYMLSEVTLSLSDDIQ